MIPAIILAGGFGTRLQSVLPDTPKALAPVGDRPFLAYQIDWLTAQGVTQIVLATHHLSEQIDAYVKSRVGGTLRIGVVRETEPLGTGGAIINALREAGIDGDVLVVNGDTHFFFTLSPIMEGYRARSGRVTLVAARMPDVARFGSVVVDGEQVTGFLQATGLRQPGLVNAGAYVLNSSAFADVAPGAFSLEKDFFPALAARGGLRAHIVDGAEVFFDIGTPDSYATFRKQPPNFKL